MEDRPRASLGFDDALEGFDPAEWTPDPVTQARARPAPDVARVAAEKTGFKSREAGQGATQAPIQAPVQPIQPQVAPAPSLPHSGAVTQPVRRRRTGRNAQFNLKAKPETIAAFCAVADANDWGLGETLEYAVALLEREHGR